ncbi:MAG TPA: HNH endonuclease [Polyangiaceae bacterium]|nr:HNH endonuclease [Polyangiaceae bacterium]
MIDSLLRDKETREDLLRTFMTNVVVHASGCWHWRGKPDAYGNFRGRPAHCVSWELHQGPIPEGLLILHGCDVAGASDRAAYGCVNPAHLRPGTTRENTADLARAKSKRPKEKPSGPQWMDNDPKAPRTLPMSIRVNEYERAVLTWLRVSDGSVSAGILRAALHEAHHVMHKRRAEST